MTQLGAFMSSWPGDQSPGYGDPGQQGAWDTAGTPGSARERIQPPPTVGQSPAYQQYVDPGQQYGYAQPSNALVQQNAWASPYAAPQQAGFAAAQPQSNGLAVASLVLGITSIVFCWWGIFSLLQVVLAIVFGCIALSRANRSGTRAPLAVGGLVCGCVGAVCYLIFGIVTLGAGLFI
jgi:hypothetical protein